MTRYGTQFSGGYQFPRTDHVQITRGQPIARHRTTKGEAQIVPLEGGRTRRYDVCALWTEGNTTISHTYVADTEDEARREFTRLVRDELGG